MATRAELEEAIRALNWADLLKLWNAIKHGDTPGWEPGKAFEYLVIRAFELDKHETDKEVRYPYEVSLFGEKAEEIDGAVHLSGLRV